MPDRGLRAVSTSLERIDENKPLLQRKGSRGSRLDDKDFIVGGSTIYQTVFNSVNILMGIGILSLPLGFAYAGWLLGGLLFFASGAVTLYTALLLSRCMADRPELQTYADVAYAAFGTKARYYVSLAFSMELLASCTALVVLFGDGLHSLMPSITATQFKLMGFFLFFGSSFVPLSILSISSIVGILATSSVVFVVIADGFIKHTSPGSLLQPAHTDWLPQKLGLTPLAIGLMMSPWSAHSVFCNVYKDMRHPHKFGKAIKTSYGITSILDIAMAVSGYLMFGNAVMDEITQSILGTEGYPQLISVLIVVMISIVPLTKMPLNTRPIATTVDVLLGVDDRVVKAHTAGSSILTRSSIRFGVRVLVNGIPVILGIFCPSFDRVMSLLGSGLCYTICVLLPVAFYLKLCGHKIGTGERMSLYVIWVFALLLGCLGTVWTFLPRELIEGL
ncbi:transmembrane amino acid transporter protein-domain-containing protein [Protomyces lactucae-debilis]|uniref:Transmembrane amino acid transporter protein-domain-containing protein n=1 Tax=Protomyces lactucae-debilis TaxID=2754530 RepID=A0A1Y2FNG9_PROLT|nr:transmembrane amino acid transporter protein-domain-containing protein [Protomyces lactucae-debilis]ORY85552.1 transmembrane amino acid transporter protein-domain-containing protein [Protomyces lactucae-debilis]